jgi:hypothetical protein
VGSQVLYDSPTQAVALTEVEFLNLSGTVADPSTITAVVVDPTGAIANYTYTAGSGLNQITRASAGNYTLTIDGIDVPGLYTYTWVGSGNQVQQVTTGTFRLIPLTDVGYGMQYWYTGMEELKSRLNITSTGPSSKNYNTFNYEMQLAIHCVSNWVNRYCIVPETPVLTADLRWVPAGSLVVGDELVGVDEYPVGPSRPKRNFRKAVVAAVPRRMAACTKITLSDGREVISAADHRWLGRSNHGKNGTVYQWLHACAIQPGYEISAPMTPWEEGSSFEDGWLSGIIDGEGCLHRTGNGTGPHVDIAQNAGAVFDGITSWLDAAKLPYKIEDSKKCLKIEVFNRWSSAELLGRTRPRRLMPRSQEVWEGGQVTGSVRVVSVEPAGVREVVSLGTTTGTYIANGLVSHNCGRHFYQVQEARTYMPDTIWELGIDDLAPGKASATTVNLDYDGDGIFETAWGNPAPPVGTGSIYQLKLGDPSNYQDNYNPNAAGGVARPYTQLQALMIPGAIATNGAWLPFVWPYSHLNRVEVVGTWGWDYVPPEVQQASLMLCTDIYKSKDTPWGMAGTAEVGLVRVQSNPWVVELLRPYISAKRKWGV